MQWQQFPFCHYRHVAQACSDDFSRWLRSKNDQSRYYELHNGNC